MKTLRLGCVLMTLQLAGCGFHPLYQTSGKQPADLGAVYVDIIPNRSGQLLRQALQARLEGASGGGDKRYTLSVAYFVAPQALGVQADNSTTRNRDVGSATWSLKSVDNVFVQLAGGTVRSVDGYNIIDEQFFYSDLSEDAAEHRIAEALADQIVTRLAAYFGRHAQS